jgi:Phage P22-like portal protein
MSHSIADMKIIEEARKDIAHHYNYFMTNISRFKEDKRFYNGEQWSGNEYDRYKSRHIQPLVMNQLKPIGRQIIGELKNMQPSIDLIPAFSDSNAEEETNFYQNLLRKIAYDSNANQCYSVCMENQISGGYGVIGVLTDYINDKTCDQEIKIRLFNEPQNVGFDPLAQRKDKTDGNFCFTWEAINKEDFEKEYPDAEPICGVGLIGNPNVYSNIAATDSVIVCEYYKRKYKNKTLVVLSDDKQIKIEIYSDEVNEAQAQYAEYMIAQGANPLEIKPLEEKKRRKVRACEIMCYKMTNAEVLERSKWPSTRLPFVFVDCSSSFQDGKQITQSFINEAKQAQKTYNFAMTNIVARLNRVRGARYLMTEKQIAGYEETYRHPDRQTNVNKFNPDPLVPGAPQVVNPEAIPQQFFDLAMQAKEDIQSTLGIYEANRGEVPNQTSGVAIGRTITQANLSLVSLWQNLFDGMKSIGEIVLELIPVIYDTERVVSTLDAMGQQKSVKVNESTEDGVAKDLTKAKFNLEVSPVANFTLQNQMETDFIKDIITLIPPAAPLLAEFMGAKIESPMRTSIVNRLRTLTPPNILQQEGVEVPPPPPPTPPSPQDQLLMAQIQKINAETQAIQEKAGVDGQKTNFEQVKHQNENYLKSNQQAIDSKKIAADYAATMIKANTEVKKAMIDNHYKSMDLIRKSQEKKDDQKDSVSRSQ